MFWKLWGRGKGFFLLSSQTSLLHSPQSGDTLSQIFTGFPQFLWTFAQGEGITIAVGAMRIGEV
jgi:hypothetical protein